MDEQAPPRTRRDYRNPSTCDPFESYLLGGYLIGRPWHPAGPVKLPAQLHQVTRTSSGHFVFIAGGVPDMAETWINHLSGYPRGAVALAIEIVRDVDPVAIACLEWHQAPRNGRPDRYAFAEGLGYGQSQVYCKHASAVHQVKAWLKAALELWEREHGG